MEVTRAAEANVEAASGTARVAVYLDPIEPFREHVAVVVGDVTRASSSASRAPVLARVHSECWTGEVLLSTGCDCRAQLDAALDAIHAEGRGVVVYLRQEGRGIGLAAKIRAYALQERGLDTVDANRALDLPDDARAYDVAAAILRDLGVSEVALLTNNPAKVEGLRAHGLVVSRRPLVVDAGARAAAYLEVKRTRMGHERE